MLLFVSGFVEVSDVKRVSFKPSEALLVLLRLRLGVLGCEAKKPTLPMFWKLSLRGSWSLGLRALRGEGGDEKISSPPDSLAWRRCVGVAGRSLTL
jgi:hypothetical protein